MLLLNNLQYQHCICFYDARNKIYDLHTRSKQSADQKKPKKYVLVEIEISENDSTQWKASNIA